MAFLGTILSISVPARAGVLGGVDLNRYCESKAGLSASEAVPGRDAYGWKCRVYNSIARIPILGWHDQGIDMNEACRQQYRNPRASAETTNRNSPWSWRCKV